MVGQISGISLPATRIISSNGARVNQAAATTPPQPSTRVTLSGATDEINAIYTIGAQKLRTSTNTGSSQIDTLMSANANKPASGAFQGLGKALLSQLVDNPKGFSAAVSSSKNIDVNGGDNASAVALDIMTQSGVKVSVSLSRQQGGIVAEVNTNGGELTDKEAASIAGLADAFQSTLDGLANTTSPTLNVDGLTKFDTSVLKSVDLNTDVRESGQSVQSLNYQSDIKQRALSYKDAGGTFQLSTDLSHPELLGTLGQQDQALAAYDKQLSAAATRGYANNGMMSMFKSAFNALNSHYGSNEIDNSHQIITVTEANKAQSYLSGLADFTASFKQTDADTNPYRQDEKDTFSYSMSQSSSVIDGVDGNRSKITQNTQSHLKASFHESLTAGTPLALSMLKSSQNYTYHQINEDTSTDTSLDFKKGRLATVNTAKQSHSREEVKTYNDARLVSDINTPMDHEEKNQLKLIIDNNINVKSK